MTSKFVTVLSKAYSISRWFSVDMTLCRLTRLRRRDLHQFPQGRSLGDRLSPTRWSIEKLTMQRAGMYCCIGKCSVPSSTKGTKLAYMCYLFDLLDTAPLYYWSAQLSSFMKLTLIIPSQNLASLALEHTSTLTWNHWFQGETSAETSNDWYKLGDGCFHVLYFLLATVLANKSINCTLCRCSIVFSNRIHYLTFAYTIVVLSCPGI